MVFEYRVAPHETAAAMLPAGAPPREVLRLARELEDPKTVLRTADDRYRRAWNAARTHTAVPAIRRLRDFARSVGAALILPRRDHKPFTEKTALFEAEVRFGEGAPYLAVTGQQLRLAERSGRLYVNHGNLTPPQARRVRSELDSGFRRDRAIVLDLSPQK